MSLATQTKIARHLGVSRQAVGFALGNDPRLHKKLRPETRSQILAAARELGYRPHRHAQIMRGARSGVLGMIQFGGMMQLAAQRAQQVANAIHDAGYQILASDVGWYTDGCPSACATMLDARVEGVVLVAASEWFPESELDRLREARIPIVSVGGVRRPGVPQVRADTRQGMFDLTQHLLQLGHRRLAMATTWPSEKHSETTDWPILDRVRGFREAIEAAGGSVTDTPRADAQADDSCIEGEVICEPFTDYWSDPYRLGEVAMQKLLRRKRRPHVVACSNDDWAIGALAACADAGVRVPEDIAVTGFDSTLAGNYAAVRLTSSALPLEAMAEKAVEILVRMTRGERISANEELVKLPCQLVVRQSCGARLEK